VDAHKASLAATAANTLVGRLGTFAPDRPDWELEDDLCAQLGPRLQEWADRPLDDAVSPTQFAEAIVTAAATAVRGRLEELSTDPDGWQAPWRVLAIAASIVPYPLSAMAADVMEQLRRLPGGHALPKAPDGPTVTGQVLWARDGYGSRFGVTAAFSMPDGPDRWYLWDIDACGHQAVTVHSAYYATLGQARAAWQAGVGSLAAGESAFTPADNRSLLADLLPAEEGLMRSGGENAEQFAEYHRSRRLAEAALQAVEPSHAAQPTEFDAAATAAQQFTAWLLTHRASERQPADLDELAGELADSWHFGRPAALFPTCSPHRVALMVLHLRNYYTDEYAAELVALLPDWIRWLGARNGTAPQLSERCQPYALGEPHPDVGTDDSVARMTE
jgi:hypothetical protein